MTQISKQYLHDSLEVRHLVDDQNDGLRLDQFLKLYLESFSREMIKKKIADKEVLIYGTNGKQREGVHKPSSLIHAKEEILIIFKKSKYEDEYWKNQKLNLPQEIETIFEDESLLVISKPAFMSTHPAGRHIFYCATVYFETKYGHTIHSLHRLDRETSGILMLGKNPEMAQSMMKNFDDEHVKKCYFFIAKNTEAYLGPKEFWAKERLASPDQDLKRILVEAYPEHATEGKAAQTFFKVLTSIDQYTFGLAFPQTGRQHQIRVHAKVHGLPLLGDKLYLGNYEMFQHFKDQIASEEEYELMEIPRHALHAIALRIPYKGKDQFFKTPIPQDLKSWIMEKFFSGSEAQKNDGKLFLENLENQIKECAYSELFK